MSGLSRTPGKRVYGESRTAGSNPALSASPCSGRRNVTVSGIVEKRHTLRLSTGSLPQPFDVGTRNGRRKSYPLRTTRC